LVQSRIEAEEKLEANTKITSKNIKNYVYNATWDMDIAEKAENKYLLNESKVPDKWPSQ
jgi:hypothetical protein